MHNDPDKRRREGRMGARVAVAGASGYAGGELLRLLAGHPDLEIGAVTAESSAGQPVTSVHPHLTGALDGIRFQETTTETLKDADLVFLALPHGASAKLATELGKSAKIVDLGADFRLESEQAWERFYKTPHPGTWTYGLPELPGAREKIQHATRVAAPGCYPTASILALAPLIQNNLISSTDIVIVAASGTSGAGRAAKPNLLGSEVMGSAAAYSVGGTHRHIPEIEQALGATVSFTPVLAPMPRGILATCTARLANGVQEQDLRAALKYENEPFVHLLPQERWPVTKATVGSNAAHLQVAADEHANRAVVIAAIDNLGKGAAGQAVQIANLMLGLPETTGLTRHGVTP
jgi:N-acetyl-gamma-glutamyl-phosphate reductase